MLLVPLICTVAGTARTVSRKGGPGTKLTVTVSFTPPAVALTSANPKLVGLLRLTVATPLTVGAVGDESAPAVVVKLTIIPSLTLTPLRSFMVAEIVV